MKTSSVIIVCALVMCSVWAVHGRNVMVSTDDQEQVDVKVSVDDGKLPGLCWACQWAMKKVKKAIGPNATAETVKGKLKAICNEIGLLKSLCIKFVDKHLSVLIEEVTTSDNVKTICVNVGACKPKQLFDLMFYRSDDDYQIEFNENP